MKTTEEKTNKQIIPPINRKTMAQSEISSTFVHRLVMHNLLNLIS